MKRVICKSGIEGWMCRLQDNYRSYQEWVAACESYGLSARLGYSSPRTAWHKNPLIQGSVIPSDYGRAKIVVKRSPTQAQMNAYPEYLVTYWDHESDTNLPIPDWDGNAKTWKGRAKTPARARAIIRAEVTAAGKTFRHRKTTLVR
jgi:hypothetical protein